MHSFNPFTKPDYVRLPISAQFLFCLFLTEFGIIRLPFTCMRSVFTVLQMLVCVMACCLRLRGREKQTVPRQHFFCCIREYHKDITPVHMHFKGLVHSEMASLSSFSFLYLLSCCFQTHMTFFVTVEHDIYKAQRTMT